jgi:hypothetical protein
VGSNEEEFTTLGSVRRGWQEGNPPAEMYDENATLDDIRRYGLQEGSTTADSNVEEYATLPSREMPPLEKEDVSWNTDNTETGFQAFPMHSKYEGEFDSRAGIEGLQRGAPRAS